ncbi:helix-turn-helix domain-containing protein, partial [Proteus mirabilis]
FIRGGRSRKTKNFGTNNEGRQEALLKGVKFGRKRSVDRERIIELKRSGWGGTAIAKEMKVARSTVYKILNEEI